MHATTFVQALLDDAERLGLDPVSFRAFYDQALPRVYGYFLRRVGSVATAEDLTQETFLAAVSELRKGRKVETPVAWVFGIARHVLVHHYRRRERVESPLPELEDARGADEDAGEGVAQERAVAALASLPASQRAAIVLRHLEGYSVPEVAEILGKSVEAAESLLSRGRAAFRHAYQETAA